MRCWTLKLFCILCFDVGIYFKFVGYKKQIDDKIGITLKRLTLVGLAVLVSVSDVAMEVSSHSTTTTQVTLTIVAE